MRHLIAAALMAAAGAAQADGAADVVAVEATPTGATWRFDVTIRSRDTGWDGYADAFEVLTPDGRVLGVRELLHPHVDEQPFTRSLRGVAIPPGVDEVTVRARHSVEGYDGATMTIALP